MALVPINQPRGKERERDTLETIALGLQIANSVLGLGKTGVDVYKTYKEAQMKKPEYDSAAEMFKSGNPLVKPKGDNTLVSFDSIGKDPSKVDYIVKNDSDLSALSKATGAGQRFITYESAQQQNEIENSRKNMNRFSDYKQRITDTWRKESEADIKNLQDMPTIQGMIESGDAQSIGMMATLIARKVGKDVGNLAEGDVKRALPGSLEQDVKKMYSYLTGSATMSVLQPEQKQALSRLVQSSKKASIESLGSKVDYLKGLFKAEDPGLFNTKDVQDQFKAFNGFVDVLSKRGENKKPADLNSTTDILKKLRGQQ
jgi:hypothetical protein